MCDGFVVPSACGWWASRWGLRCRSIVAADIDRNSSSIASDTRLWMGPSSLKRINRSRVLPMTAVRYFPDGCSCRAHISWRAMGAS